jgi:hypothetical protein
MKFKQWFYLNMKRYNFSPGMVQNPTELIAKRNYLDLALVAAGKIAKAR